MTLHAIRHSDRWRSAQLALLGLLFAWLAHGFGLQESVPGFQADLHSFSIIFLRGTAGYWVARICLGRLTNYSTRDDVLARAFVIGMVVVSFK